MDPVRPAPEIPQGWYVLRPNEIVEETDKRWSHYGQCWDTIKTAEDRKLLVGQRASSSQVPPPNIVIRKGERPSLEGWDGFPLGGPGDEK